MKKKSRLFFRKFGIELEFSTPLQDAKNIIQRIIRKVCGKNKLLVDSFSYTSAHPYKKWEFKYDGSTECELTTPISTTFNFKTITKVLQEITKNKLKISNNDSVHVHMQANDVPKHNIIAAWIQIENTIMKCFPKHRRNNGYCQKLIHKKRYKKISDFFMDAEDDSGAHHAILSLSYYSERKTIEFRIMEGNTNPNDIVPWIKFCMLFLNYAKTIDPVKIICDKKKKQLSINEVIAMLNINNKEIVDFLVRREKKFRNG